MGFVETLATGIGALSAAAQGASQLSQQPQQPGIPQASLVPPQAPAAMPVPQLSAPAAAPQNDLLAMLNSMGGQR